MADSKAESIKAITSKYDERVYKKILDFGQKAPTDIKLWTAFDISEWWSIVFYIQKLYEMNASIMTIADFNALIDLLDFTELSAAAMKGDYRRIFTMPRVRRVLH